MDCFKQDALCPFFDAIPRFKEEFERMAKYSPQDILRMVEENQVRFIRLQFTDIFGAMKCVNVTASQLQKVLRNECKFDGSSIVGFTRRAHHRRRALCRLPALRAAPRARPRQGHGL